MQRKHLRFLFLFSLIVLGYLQKANSQTTLAAGDVAVIAFGPSSTDHFAVVLLKDIATGTVINFTDNGLASATTGATSEGYLTYTAPSKQCAGTVLTWTNGMTITGTGWNSNNPSNFALSSSGEQLFVFQGNGSGGTTITTNFGTQSGTTSDNEWAAQTGITLLYGIQTDIAWITSGGANNNQSYQPSISILPPVDVIEFTSKSDVYITSTTLSGTQSAILTTLNTSSNYTTSGSSVTFSSYTSFTVNILSVNNGTICGTGSVALTATGVSTYSWSPATNLTPTTGAGVTASPTATTTYTVTGTSAVGCTSTANSIVTVTPISNVTGTSVASDNGQLTITWTNPSSCFDAIMIVGKSSSAVTSTPSGNGTSYSPNQLFGTSPSGTNLNSGEYDVYQSTGTSVVVLGLTDGTTYDFKIFTRSGTIWSSGATVSGTPNPVTGDYRSTQNGNWSSTGTWQVYSGSSWGAASSYPHTSTVNVMVSNTVTVDNAASPYKIKSLIVQSGGTVYCNTHTGTLLYVDIYGNITCTGTIGNSPTNDDLGINVDGTNCIIAGTGTCACARIRKNNNDNSTTNLTVEMNISFLWNTSTEDAFLYDNQSATIFNLTTLAGTTLSCTNTALDVAIDGSAGAATDERGGTYTINGTLSIAGILHLTTQNSTNACTVIINNAGIINVANIDASASNHSAAPSVLTINSGGLLNITGTAGISPFSTTDNTYNLNTGSTVQYSASGTQTIETGIEAYSYITCSGSGDKTLNGNITINGNLIVNAAIFDCPNSSTTMTIAGNITLQSGGTMSNHCYNNLRLTTSGASTQTFTGGTNSIQCYNLTSIASLGGITLTGGSGQTTLNIGNNFSVDYTSTAVFTDNGNTIIVGNNAALGTSASNFSFTGTMKFICFASNSTLSDYSGSLICPAQLYNLTIDAASSSKILEIMPSPSGGQNLYVNGSVTIANTSQSTNFNPNGNILNVGGNWTTYSYQALQAIVNGNSTIIFNGASGSSQTLTSGDHESFYNWQVNNANGVTLSSTVDVTGQFTLTNGVVTTGANEVDATGSVTGYSAASYINGNLQRSVAATGSYDFPVGTGSNYELATLNLISSTGISDITASFTSTPPAQPSPSTCFINSTPIGSMLNGGFWTLTPTATFTAADYDITLKETGYTNFTGSATELGVIKRHSSSVAWAGTNLSGGTGGTQGYHSNSTQSISSGVATAKRTGVQSFSDYGIGFGAYALPVTLTTFDATPDGNNVLLTWETESEYNNKYFAIERSSNAIDFTQIGEVAGKGTTTEASSYSFPDGNPLSGVSYYRLRQVDKDGTATYSQIRAVQFNITNSSISIYPVPASTVLQVNGITEEATYKVYDISGRYIQNGTIAPGETSISITSLSAGVYLLELNNGGTLFHQKFIKE